MLWIWQEEVLPGSNYGAVIQRSRDLDLNGVSSNLLREDLEALPPLFYHLLCLDLCLAKAWSPLGGAQDHLAA